MRASECPCSNCSMRACTLAAITSFAVCSAAVGVGGGLVDGCGGGVHGCFLLGLLHWPLPLNRAAACTYMPNASWRRRGVASARGGGSPTLGTKRSGSGKGGAKRRAAQAKRGSLGKPLAGARGGAPLRGFCCCCCSSRESGPALRAGTGPLRRVAEDGNAGRRQGGTLLPPGRAAI